MRGRTFFQTHAETKKKFSLIRSFLSILLWSTSYSNFVSLFCQIWSELQIFSLILENILNGTTLIISDAYSIFISNIIRIISFQDVLNIQDLDSVALNLKISGIIVLVILLYMCMAVYKASRSSGSIFFMHPFWMNINECYHKICYLYIHQVSIKIISNYFLDTKTAISNERSLVSISIAILIVNLFLGYFFSRTFYESIRNSNLLCVRSHTNNMFSFIFKTTDILLLNSLTTDFEIWIRIGASALLIGARSWNYYREIPYYNFHILKSFFQIQSAQIGFICIGLVTITLQSFTKLYFSFPVYILTMMIPILLKVSFNFFEKVIEEYLLLDFSEIKSSNNFFKKIAALELYMKSIIDERSNLNTPKHKKLMLGILKEHQSSCQAYRCACNLILENESFIIQTPNKAVQREAINKFFIDYIQQLYVLAERKFHDALIKLSLATFLYNQREQGYITAIGIVHSLKFEDSFHSKVIGKKILLIIEQKIQEQANEIQILNLKPLIDFQNIRENLYENIKQSCLYYRTFWEKFQNSKFKFSALLEYSHKTNKFALKTDNYWNYIIQNFPEFCVNEYLVYGFYQALILNAPYSAEISFQNYFLLSLEKKYEEDVEDDDLGHHNLHSDRNTVILVSLKKEEFGRIVYTTPNLQFLGYSFEEFLRKNLTQILFLYNRDKSYLPTFLEKNSNRNFDTFLIHKAGHIVHSNFYVAPYPYCHLGFYYVIIFRPKVTLRESLFISTEGLILGMTGGLYGSFKVKPEKNKHFLHHFTEESGRIRRVFKKMLDLDPKEQVVERKIVKLKTLVEDIAIGASEILDKDAKEGNENSTLLLDNLSSMRNSRSRLTLKGTSRHESKKGASLGEVFDYENLKTGGIPIEFFEYKSAGERSHLFLTQIVKEDFAERTCFYLVLLPFDKYQTEFLSNQDDDEEEQSEDSFEDEFPPEDEGINLVNSSNMLPAQSMVSTQRYNLQSPSNTERLLLNNTFFSKIIQKLPATSIQNFNEQPSERAHEISKRKTKFLKDKYMSESAEDKSKSSEGQSLQKFILKTEILRFDAFAKEDKIQRETGVNAKLEQAIYITPKNRLVRSLWILIILFIIIMVALLVIIQIYTQISISTLKSYSAILIYSLERFVYIMQSAQYVATQVSILQGFSNNVRAGENDVLSAISLKFRESIDKLTYYNSILLNSNDDKEEIAIFFEKIEVVSLSNFSHTNMMNSFELCSQLAAASLSYYQTLLDHTVNPSLEKGESAFILTNSLNDIYDYSIKLSEMIFMRTTKKIDYLSDLALISSIFIGILGLILIIPIMIYDFQKNKEKERFKEIIYKIKFAEIEETIATSKILFDFAASNEKRLKEFEENYKQLVKAKKTIKKIDQKLSNKIGNEIEKNEGPNLWSLACFILALFCYTFLFVGFLMITNSYQKKIVFLQEGQNKAYYFISEYSFSFTTLHLDILSNGTFITKNKPSEISNLESIQKLKASISFLSSLVNENIVSDFGLEELLNGDLCTFLLINFRECISEGAGSSTRGLTAINDFMFNRLSTYAYEWQTSNRDLVSGKAILMDSQYEQTENMYYKSLLPGLRELSDAFHRLIFEKINQFSSSLSYLFIGSAFAILIISRLLFSLHISKLISEASKMRQVLRIIPLSIIVGNRDLRGYLINNCENLLETVKEKL